MNFARFRPLMALVAAASLALVPMMAFGQTTKKELTAEAKADILASVQQIVMGRAFVPGADFTKWPELMKAKKDEIANAKTDMEMAMVVNQALSEFHFSHIALIPPQDGDQRVTQKRTGIGIRIMIEDGGLRITDVFPGGPAAEAGFQVGDLVFESDGHPVKAVADLAGDDGQKSTVKVKRDGKTKEFDVTRRPYSTVIPESLQWKGDTAILTIPTFDVGYDRENIDGLMEQAMKAKTLVIDLRSNGGGAVYNLTHMLGYFLDRSEPIGTFIGRQAVADYKEKNGEETSDPIKLVDYSKSKVLPGKSMTKFTGKVAVLIGPATGSASEMFAAAMRDYRGAAMIGQRSAGAVLASLISQLDNGHGFWIQYPMLDYVTIKNVRLEGTGITPDLKAAPPTYGHEDEGIAAAIKWANSASGDLKKAS
jgi:carboxyl-terminal processing protease